jgi:hypothetical protein
MKTLRLACLTMVLLIPGFRSGAAGLPSQVEGHRSGLKARVVSADGTSRTIRLEGVGCTESMCSRVLIRGNRESGAPIRTWLDSIAAIKDATANDALFVMRDGTERRMILVPYFRVLYVSNPNGRTEKLDLTTIRSLEFLAPAR